MSIAVINPVIDLSVRELCYRPYSGHKKGCPNYNKKAGCPPNTPAINEFLDFGKPIWAVWIEFDLADHRERMRKKHPKWSRRQLDCCLYWQGTVRKFLKHKVTNFCTEQLLFKQAKTLEVLYVPEAFGVNVTATMKKIGVILEWPPENIVRKIAFIGTPV